MEGLAMPWNSAVLEKLPRMQDIEISLDL